MGIGVDVSGGGIAEGFWFVGVEGRRGRQEFTNDGGEAGTGRLDGFEGGYFRFFVLVVVVAVDFLQY